MALTPDDLELVARISKRLQGADPETYRAGGRALAHQAIEHRGDLVRTLRGALAELDSKHWDERRQGYQEALEDVLLAAEAAIEPREQMAVAQASLATSPALKKMLDEVARGPLTPSEAARRIDKSPSMGTRYFDHLRTLGLLTELDGIDGRERPHRVTPLGARLANVAVATERDLRATRKDAERVLGEIERLLPEVEKIVAASDASRAAIDKVQAILEKAREPGAEPFGKFLVVKKPARPARDEGINPFTKEKRLFAGKPASKVGRARTIKMVKEAVAKERKGG